MAFTRKVDSLFNKEKNEFLEAGLKVSAETLSDNGALKYSTSGNEFVDDFAKVALYKAPRTYQEVSQTMQLLWSIDPLKCLKLAVYIRLITRKTKLDTGETLENQQGQGLKNEGIMRMLWIALNHPKTFKVNLPIFIAAGSWKDIFQMMSLDLQYHGWSQKKLDWQFLYSVILAGLDNKETTHLVRKYLPTIRTNKHCKTLESQADTLIGRFIAHKLNSKLKKDQAAKAYRQIKSRGVAHEWQQLISKQLYEEINFDHIAGRALSLLVNSKFLENHHLTEKYQEWINSKKTAKYTGFIYELFAHRLEERYQIDTANAQFMKLVENAPDTQSAFLVVRDTSGSMTARACGTKVSSNDIAKSMALYFSYFLKGVFSNTYADFANTCQLVQWQGQTPYDKYQNDRRESYGSTDFQSVIDLFIELKEKGVPESDFPQGILLLSDGEFNYGRSNNQTNFEEAISRLREANFSEEYVNNFKIVLWDIPNGFYGHPGRVQFESFADAPNFFYISGFDGSIISFLLGGEAPKNAAELVDAALDQELLDMLTVL